MQKNLILTLVLAIIIATFAILNASTIEVNLLFVKVNVSAALVILTATFLGAIIVYLVDMVARLKLKRELKEKKQVIQELKAANDELLIALDAKRDQEIGKE